MRNNSLIVSIIFSLLTAGCAASGQLYKNRSIDSGESEIIIFRKNQFVGGGQCYVIYIDGKELSSLSNGGFLRTSVPSGEHKVSVFLMNKTFGVVSLKSKPNSKNFIEYNDTLNEIGVVSIGTSSSTSVAISSKFAEVTESYALSQLSELRDSSEKASCLVTVRPD